jgi:hypothetical protein
MSGGWKFGRQEEVESAELEWNEAVAFPGCVSTRRRRWN